MIGVGYESQVYASCDSCGENEATSFCTLAEYKKILRSKGWRVGMVTLCPRCNAERRCTKSKVMKMRGGAADENA